MDLEVFGEYQDKIDYLVSLETRISFISSWFVCQSKLDERLCNDYLYGAIYDYINEVAN